MTAFITSRHLSRNFFIGRLYSSAPVVPSAVLVGSPDMISNLRPAIYDGVWFKAVSAPPDPSSSSSIPSVLLHPDPDTEHPYALSEFPSTRGHETDRFFAERKSAELQYRLLKQSLDAFNHAFWTDTNTRFNAYKHFVETSTKASPEFQNAAPEVADQLLEKATANFYQVWQRIEAKRQRAYTKEMYRRTWALIRQGTHNQVQKFRWAIQSLTTRNII